VSDADPIAAGEAARRHLTLVLARIASGDRAAMKELYALTSGKLFGVCLRICSERSAAEDVLQDVYLKVWKRAGRYDPARASPITWLATIARNTAIDWRRANGTVMLEADSAAATIADERLRADQLLERAGTHGRIHHCLGTLEEKQAQSIRAAFLDGLTYAELAERMRTPLGTIKSWIRRGLLRLRECIGDA
jgi:RNA polymerase sigma-70 factor (ECF subfamily)